MDTKITSGYLLKLVSRSFALAIPLLDKNKRLAVETQYLLARVIDTIEDSPLSMDDKDTLIGAFNNILLTTDTEKLLAIKNIVHENTTSENDKMLVDNVQLVLDNFFTLDSKIQNISTTYLKEMGYGMLYYQDHDVETFEDLDDYCYYVAGTVGLYLTELVEIVDERELSRDYSKSFARFLQKVNIIRDAKEDLKENRIFWPKEIIGEFKIEDLFENPDYENQALLILDNMINNALAEFEQTIYYISSIDCKESKGYRNFTLVSAIMAFETLKLLRNNYDVFSGEPIKIAKKLTLEIIAKIKAGFYTDKELLGILSESKSI